ncbi:MAG TPA: LLM class flavin-dependent oxidoreductase [Myxococcota bacterium]|nr:LLM class flavin-dependent oxidoreductase [Myxococcota bacterium]
MKFGAMIQPRIDDLDLPRDIERMGYDSLWVPDSHMIASDCYAVMALAAVNTSRIRIGTGVSIASTRIAPVTAAAIASVNRLAPGRVFLGLGTGHTALRTMGFDPVPPKEFRDYVRVTCELLRTGKAEFHWRGKTRRIEFMFKRLGVIDIEHRIPVYVAANGPKALEIAGEYGDGRVSADNERPEQLAPSLGAIQAAARAAGRELPRDFHTATLAFVCVMRPGETLRSERVVDQVAPMSVAYLRYWYEWCKKSGSDALIPEEIRAEYKEFVEHVGKMQTPADHRYVELHDGHCTYPIASERRFVTPNVIRAARGFVGEPDEIIHMLRERERAGLREIAFLPPIDSAREIFRDFAEQVIARY